MVCLGVSQGLFLPRVSLDGAAVRLPAGVPRLCGLWLGKGRGRDSGLLDGGVNLGAVSWGAMVNLKQSVIVHYSLETENQH